MGPDLTPTRALRPYRVLYWGQLARENERLDEIAARLEALDAELVGRTTMSITQYREVAAMKQGAPAGQTAAGRLVHVISTSRYPGRTFAVVDDTVTESAQALEAILGRLRTVFMARQIVRVEVRRCSANGGVTAGGQGWKRGRVCARRAEQASAGQAPLSDLLLGQARLGRRFHSCPSAGPGPAAFAAHPTPTQPPPNPNPTPHPSTQPFAVSLFSLFSPFPRFPPIPNSHR